MSRLGKIACRVGIPLIVVVVYIWMDYIGGVNHPSPKVSCIANLKQLHGAKASWALEMHKTNPNEIPSETEIFGRNGYIFEKPKCPEGGTYTVGSMGEPPRCSIPLHNIDSGHVYVRSERDEPLSG